MPRISKTTEYNWKKLNSDSKEKLTKRANKTMSTRRITASNYLDDSKANLLLHKLLEIESPVESVIYTLVCSVLSYYGLAQKPHVRRFLQKYSHLECLNIDIPEEIWDYGEDVLGFIYQSLITEGERNLTGQYYTCKSVVEYILDGKTLADDETFLDPCCGSGAFLLGVTTNNPSNLYGFDINPVAVMIASANILVKYKDKEFSPNVFCMDFLNIDSSRHDGLPLRFDNIYTNPPWGSDKDCLYVHKYPSIKSKERASMVITESLGRLSENGTLYFLLPSSLLKIKRHSDIRKIILSDTAIQRIDLYKNRFDGVFTDYFSIKVRPVRTATQKYLVSSDRGIETVLLSEKDKEAGKIAVETFSEIELSIINKMESSCHDRLSHSQWALGIVTGDNKSKVKKVKKEGLEAVCLGKHVGPFNVREMSSYIFFDPKDFQQCAKVHYFRAPEKLIYRFIAKYPIVAYDDKQRLCINSANILIPQLDTISIKSVASLLNSTLYHYYYSLKFPDIKVLKGNLQELPFPKLTKKQDEELSSLAADIQLGTFDEHYKRQLDNMVYSIFGITSEEQEHILGRLK
ncbi:MAG: TaqI-like C-terminal specificity domain-containing protein [Candidatus Limimorpha sp.]